ncbi:glycosyltransferase [Olleya aquimaris]|uniref:Glycosyltransferase family 4 protein n=1 Tax=Olleya sediminilitoris TaxID=2795739 RepID=A0ABS1WHB8_9FLAO|nr:glycosyltransferase family 4 protein [Olleya sediminilitoris]AXO80785.1 glycosyltransferase [Olleya aquimaris]MBL7558513.1 glycosyltransferase family 4 protein [Olleya sediminilitoris]
MKVLLVSGSVSNSGHGTVYLNNIHKNLKDIDTDIFVPKDAILGDTDIDVNSIHKSDLSFSKLSRQNYAKYGKLGIVKRGFDRVFNGIKFHKDLLKHLKIKNYDVVHILDSEYISYWYLAKKLKNKHVRLVYTLHASDFNLQSFTIGSVYKYLIKTMLNKSFSKTAHVVCHGEWIKDRLVLAFPKLKNKISGIDYPSNAYTKIDKDNLKAELGVPLDKTIISFLGMIRRDKKIEVAIQTIKQLPDNFHFVIAGSLSDYKLEEIESLIKEAKIESRVTRTFKYLSLKEYEDNFKASDIFLSTHSDSFPSASGPVSDARSYGVPVVVPPKGQLEMYVNINKVGQVAKKHNAKDFADACLLVNNEINHYKNNVIKVSQNLSWESFGNKHVSIYNG